MDIIQASADLCDPILVFDSRDEGIKATLPFLLGVATDPSMSPTFRRRHWQDDLDTAREVVTTFSDYCIRNAAKLARELDLTFHTPAVARLLTDKFAQRTVLNAKGVGNYVEVTKISTSGALRNTIQSRPFPQVLKPISHSGGSRMTFRIDCDTDIQRLEDSFRVSSNSDAEGFVLEPLVSGEPHPAAQWLADYVSIESACEEGHFTHFCGMDRLHPTWPFRETGILLPSSLPLELRLQIEETTTAALRALGVKTGITHTELKLTQPEPTIIEVNGVGLAGGIGRLLPRISDFNPVRLALKLSLGMRSGSIAFKASQFALNTSSSTSPR